MTSPFRSRRDADELHDALVGTAGPGVAERHGDLLRTVSLLTTHTPVTPRPDFSLDLRERLMAAAATELVAAPAPARRPVEVVPSPTRRRLATVAASLVVVGGTAGMAAAAQGALPGDPLYPIKRGGEAVVAALEPGSTGSSDLGRAGERLDEAVALQRGGADTDLVVRTLDEFVAASRNGASALLDDYRADGDPAPVDELREFTAGALPRLDDLAQAEPGLAGTVVSAAETLESIDAEARTLCPTCGLDAALSLPTSLVQGAAAASLSTLLAAPTQQARLDAETLAGLDTEQIRQLGEAAETTAGTLAPVVPGTTTPGTGGVWPVVPETSRGPVGSVLTTTTDGVTTTVGGTVEGATGAVDNLVGGIRGTVGGVSGIVPRDTPLGATVGGLTDTVDQALEGVSGITGGLGKTVDDTVRGISPRN